MYRIFISHSNVESRQAKALKRWLVEQDPPLANEIFLASDRQTGIHVGKKWKEELHRAMAHCEAVICLVSASWNERPHCIAEFHAAGYLNKRIFCARLESPAENEYDDPTDEYQHADLFGSGEQVEIAIDDDDDDSPVRFIKNGLLRLKDEIILRGIGAESFVWPPPDKRQSKRAPYRGWDPLDEMDAAVYFGRDAEIIRASHKLRVMRDSALEGSLFVILGPSGSGKSSFLRAGLLPRLRRADRDFVVLDKIVRPERKPLTGDNGLAEAIEATRMRLACEGLELADVKQACLVSTATVHELLSEIRQAATRPSRDGSEADSVPTVVITIDQAEELFSADAGPEAERFLLLLADLLGRMNATDTGLIVAVTIRTDHHEALQTAKQLAGVDRVVFDDLKPMHPAQFKEVIVGPVRRATEGGRPLVIEEALVEQLLKDCNEGADTLPLLALSLARLFKDYGRDGDLTLDEYQRMGGMLSVVQTEVDKILSSNGEERKKQLNKLRPAFIPWLAKINRGRPVRRVARWADLPVTAKPLLAEFVEKRLLVRYARDGEDVVEVALESLFWHWSELQEWLEQDRESLKHADTLKQAADEWEERNRDDAGLLKDQRLIDAEHLAERPDYCHHVASAGAFIKASRKHEEHRKWVERRRRIVFRSLLACAVIVALVAAFLLFKFTRSQEEKTRAEQATEASTRQNRAWQLVSEAEQMLKGGREGGDVRAMQELLAADYLGATAAEAVVNTRRNVIKLMENPRLGGGEHVTGVRAVAVSPGGNRIATGNDDNVVRIWDADSGSAVRELVVGDAAGASGVAFSTDGRWIATGNDDGILQVWDASGGEPIGKPMVHSAPVNSVSFTRDSKRIATGSRDGAVHIWDWESGNKVEKQPTAHAQGRSVRTVAFNPGGDLVVSGGDDGAVHLWNAQTGVEITQPVAGQTMVMSVAYNDAGNRVVVGLWDGTVQILDGQTLVPVGDRINAFASPVNSVAFARDGGNRIVAGSADNTIRVWDATTHAVIGDPLIGHHGEVSSVAFNADGTRVVSGAMDGSVRVWDVVAGLPIPAGDDDEIRSVAFSPGGSMMASGGTNGTVNLWNPVTGALVGHLAEGAPSSRPAVNSLAFSHDGTRLVTGAFDGKVRLWDVKHGHLIKVLPLEKPTGLAPSDNPRIQSVAFSTDGSLIASGGMDGAVRLWNARTLESVGVKTAHKIDPLGNAVPYQVWSVAFSSGGQLVSGSGPDENGEDTNFVQLWDVNPLAENGAPMLAGANSVVSSVAFSPNGERIVSGSHDGTIWLWDVASRQPVLQMSGDQNQVFSVAFAHNEPWVASAGADGKVRLWKVDGDQAQPIGTPLEGHRGWIHSVAFSPNDERLLSGSADGTLRLWSAPRDLAEVICSKLSSDMTPDQWHEWVSPDIDHEQLCRIDGE